MKFLAVGKLRTACLIKSHAAEIFSVVVFMVVCFFCKVTSKRDRFSTFSEKLQGNDDYSNASLFLDANFSLIFTIIF